MDGMIAILDDNQERIAAMERRLNESFADWEHIFFNNAPDAIAWLEDHLHECVLISLDHDLGPSWERNGQLFDPGIGRDVVDYLITKPPQCPVILHTSNGDAEIGMEMALAEANWTFERVIPFHSLDDIDSWEWLDRDWVKAIQRLVKPMVKTNNIHQGDNDSARQKPEVQPVPASRMIIVLDSSQNCEELIQAQLEEAFPAWSSVSFKSSFELIAWLSSNTPQFNRLCRAKTIAILDNSKKRVELMRHQLDRLFPDYASVFFDSAPDIIAWWETNLEKCALIGVDYNLGGSWTRGNRVFDPGTGRDAIDYLATQPSQCPILFHTSSKEAEIGMEMGLIESDWIFDRVVHPNDLKWIEKDWIAMVQLLLNPIANADLKELDIPFTNARWQLYDRFALTFDGYGYWESAQKCIEIGDRCAERYQKKGILPKSLTELRTALLVERNYWRRYNMEPDEEAMTYIQAIAHGIRDKVRDRELD